MKKLQITESQKKTLETEAAATVIAALLALVSVGVVQLAKVVTEVKVDLTDIIPTPD